MLHYLDPPYRGCETDYGQGMFERTDFDQLARIRGRYILSINDTLRARGTFPRLHVATAETMYTVETGAAQRAGKPIVCNFKRVEVSTTRRSCRADRSDTRTGVWGGQVYAGSSVAIFLLELKTACITARLQSEMRLRRRRLSARQT